MQKEAESKRKRMVKRVAVIFLVTLLILTFFSNTILNYSLPEVATAYVSSGPVSNKVRVQGTVEMSSDYTVEVSGTRVIKEVMIEPGDTVKKDQILFTFEEGENTELAEAQATLDQMELDYAKSLLKIAPDYESDNEDIKEAKKALQDAIDAQTKAEKTAKKKKAAEKAEKSAQKKVDAKQKEVDSLQEQVDAYAEIGDYDTVATSLAEDKKMLSTLKTELSDLKEDLAAAKKAVEGSEESSDETIVSLNRAIRDKETAIKDKEADITAKETLLKSLEPSKQIKENLKTATKELAALKVTLEEKTKALAEYDGVLSVEDAKAAVKEKQSALDQLIKALEDKKEQDAITAKSDAMDQEAAEKSIEEQKKKVKELEESNDLTEIKAKEDGLVSTVSCKEGDTVAADTALAEIQSLNSSYLVNTTVTTAQAGLLHVGDEATIENVWDREMTATVRSLKVNPEDPNQSKLISFEISDNATPGETLQLMAGEKTASYDTIVPNNAVKEDSNGHFVLVVRVKGTPLGNRYTVHRVDVEVEASDESNSAVTGALYEYDNVVTNSSRPLEDKMQVRLAE